MSPFKDVASGYGTRRGPGYIKESTYRSLLVDRHLEVLQQRGTTHLGFWRSYRRLIATTLKQGGLEGQGRRRGRRIYSLNHWVFWPLKLGLHILKRLKWRRRTNTVSSLPAFVLASSEYSQYTAPKCSSSSSQPKSNMHKPSGEDESPETRKIRGHFSTETNAARKVNYGVAERFKCLSTRRKSRRRRREESVREDKGLKVTGSRGRTRGLLGIHGRSRRSEGAGGCTLAELRQLANGDRESIAAIGDVREQKQTPVFDGSIVIAAFPGSLGSNDEGAAGPGDPPMIDDHAGLRSLEAIWERP
uniref:Uncharacterized protein n=1 Tax=Steinernema glaseri TaxID=37863 RepID=A0A1I7Y1K5_9BILA